jgi:hypothetical protein
LGILDRIFRKTNKQLSQIVAQSVRASIQGLSGGKQTKQKWEEQFHWYDQILKRSDFRTKNVMGNLKVIRDLNPDASMAIWNFLRLSNTGHEIEVETPTGATDKQSTDLINDLAARVGTFYGGGVDQLINVLLLTAFTQGAIALEVEIEEGLNDIVDFHPVDPSSLDYRRSKETGEMELVQKNWDGSYTVLNPETVFYYPIDPDIEDPYGRSPILPILQVVFFQIEVLKDLKKVIHHQGYERFDISVVEEAIMENMPDYIKNGSPEEINNYVQSYVSDIQKQMASLEPDDDFFHPDSVEIKTVGGVSRGSMDATKVIDVINQQIVTSLKQLPILLGRNEGSTETHGTIQWQIYVAGIESIQRAIKRVLERAYNVSLQVYGKQRKARLTFNTLRTQDRLKEAQAEGQETQNKILQYNQGWITNDEAAMEMVGHEAVDEPKPMVPQSPVIPEEEEEEDRDIEEEKEKEERVIRFKQRKKGLAHDSRKQDDFVLDIKESWAESISSLTYRATKSFRQFLKDQRTEYIKRIQVTPGIPTRVMLDIRSLQDLNVRSPDPTEDFIEWVRVNILYDSEAQLSLWDMFGRDWMEQAAEQAGIISMFELDEDFDFDSQDTALLRSLSDRSRRSAELIQGVTDEDVIMTLWDVVYEGKYSIPKAVEALKESFAFSQSRAKTIARTEMIGSARTGQYFADRQSGMVIGKIWKAAQQERTRDGHRAADSQVVRFDEPFYVANGDGQLEMLMFPGDTSLGASASNIINCRCWYKRILQGEEDMLKG